jgi:type VI secretion system protein ImpC
MLRMPYGKKSDPIDAFAFEEFTRQGGLSSMLWGHPALVPALLLAETWGQQGSKMKLGSVMGVRDMPYYVYIGPDHEPIALPCTERMYSERQAVQVASYKVMPLLSIRGRPEARLGGFASLAGKPLAGFWAPFDAKAPPGTSPAPSPAAPTPAAPASEPEAAADEPAPAEDAAMSDLDKMLAGLNAPAEPAAAEEAPAEDAAMSDLDALLASLNAPAEPVAEDATEPDLDALLASLK